MINYQQGNLLEARAEAASAVARQKCRDRMARLKELCVLDAQSVEAQALADAARPPPVATMRLDGVRVQRAVVETHKPAAAPFKALAL